MSLLLARLLGDWRHLVQKPISAEDVERAVERGSTPAFALPAPAFLKYSPISQTMS